MAILCVMFSYVFVILIGCPGRSKAILLLWILFAICVSCLSCCLVCSLQPCGHLLGKGLPLGSFVCDVFLCCCHLPIWCPGTGVVGI